MTTPRTDGWTIGTGPRVNCHVSHPGPLPATEIIAQQTTLPRLACAGTPTHLRALRGRSLPGGGLTPEPVDVTHWPAGVGH